MKITYELEAIVTSSSDGDRVRLRSSDEDREKAREIDRVLSTALRFEVGKNPGFVGGKKYKLTIEG